MDTPRRRLVVVACVLAAVLWPAAPAAAGVIVALGDSLTAGLGVAPDEAWPARLQARLRGGGWDYRVVNAGVSGDTTAGGLRRLDWVLRAEPEVAIVALGANDGLRGQSVAAMRANLRAIVDRLRARGVRVLLAGMRMPPNYGDAYTRAFAAAFGEVARGAGAALMPFLLEGVAAVPSLNQADGIHPNAEGHRIIADSIWAYVKPLLESPARRPARDRRGGWAPASPTRPSASLFPPPREGTRRPGDQRGGGAAGVPPSAG
ncbi:MAG: arylesterase [Candidatus Rokuibacteriota bacterium]